MPPFVPILLKLENVNRNNMYGMHGNNFNFVVAGPSQQPIVEL